jgi:outer membrane immunogenic protein
MKQLSIAVFASLVLSLTTFAGPESLPGGKEMKQVAPAPLPELTWTGLYVGLHAGGQFGHSETNDLDDYYFFAHHHFGYRESGFNGGGQIGYNFQLGRIVVGPEFDIGYMNLDGTGDERIRHEAFGIAHGSSDSDFYTTFRGRVGYALGADQGWLFYATGGAIGVNYYTHYLAIEQNIVLCGVDARKTDLDWGYTVGGGIERRLGRHWSIKVEYLYFSLGEQSFSGREFAQNMGTTLDVYRFEGETMGHIVRAGLNFHF